jgi:hypothetical protein
VKVVGSFSFGLHRSNLTFAGTKNVRGCTTQIIYLNMIYIFETFLFKFTLLGVSSTNGSAASLNWRHFFKFYNTYADRLPLMKKS